MSWSTDRNGEGWFEKDGEAPKGRSVSSQAAGREWQPIETAPRDGTTIVAHDATTGTSHVTYWAYGWHDPDSHYYSEAPEFRPTDWWPLPTPPAARSQSEDTQRSDSEATASAKGETS
jgi:hypothetical protein